MLNQPDVTVTNQSDKVTLLGKLPTLETELAELNLPFPEHLGLSADDPDSTVPPAAGEDDLGMTSLDLSTYDEERQDANLVRLFLLPRDVILRWRTSIECFECFGLRVGMCML